MANQVLYGFYNRRDLLDQRVTDSNIPEFNTAIDATLAEHERQLRSMISLFAEPTTMYKERYRNASQTRNQPLDENGKALPIKAAGYIDVAYPLHISGNAWGANYITRAKMKGSEVQAIVNTLMIGDARWMRDHLLAALFADDGWTFSDPAYGNLTVEGLANGDSVTYQIQSGADSSATDTHILAQANAIDDSNNPFDNIYEELMEHPENGGEVVAIIPTNLKASVEALTAYKPLKDPNIQVGQDTDVLTGTLGVAVPGQVIGYVNKVWIVEWKAMPSSYIIAACTDGDRALAMREEPEPELQGFKRVTDGTSPADHPFYESQYLRIAGFGGRNRVGAVVYRVGNGSYAVPTNYGSPMP